MTTDYMMGLATFILCLIVGCRSDYSRYSESSESSETIHPNSYYMTRPRPLLSPQESRPAYFTRSRYFIGARPFVNQPSPYQQPLRQAFGSNQMTINGQYQGPASLKPQIVAEDLPVSYDGASLSDRNPSIHYWRKGPSTLTSAHFRSEPVSQPEYGFAESSAHSAAKYDDSGDDGDDQDEQEYDYSLENTQSSSAENQNPHDRDDPKE